MNDDLISRQNAVDAILELSEKVADEMLFIDAIVDEIENIPSAEPERHRGEWIEDGHERGFSECSKCGYIAVSVITERLYNFCPNCGADMRGTDEKNLG